MDKTLIDCLYEELANLDEQAGYFDEITNSAIDKQRDAIMVQLIELESA